jgi:hypothetical protein
MWFAVLVACCMMISSLVYSSALKMGDHIFLLCNVISQKVKLFIAVDVENPKSQP